jgi:hypothetical protein
MDSCQAKDDRARKKELRRMPGNRASRFATKELPVPDTAPLAALAINAVRLVVLALLSAPRWL